MANPQPENGFVKLANEIWNEIIRRDFSKRQKDIILFIWRLSYGCGKKTALVPLLKDFELCGVGYQNIRKEIDHLSNCKVVSWDQNRNVFSVNKDYDQWQISPVKGWDEKKFKDLISKNLDEKKINSSQNKKIEKRVLHGDLLFASQNKKWLLLKIRSHSFLKREARLPSNPCGCRKKGVSKDIIKNNIKNISCCLGKSDSEIGQAFTTQNESNSESQDAVPAGDVDSNREANELDYRKQVADRYLARRGKGLEITAKDELILDELIADAVPIHIALAGIDKAFNTFKPKHKKDEIKSLSYCEGIIYALHTEAIEQSEKMKDTKASEAPDNEPPDNIPTEEDVQRMLAEMRSKRGGD
ncbi:replication protein [Paenibacillus odorifer]|uniref:Bacteriophage lambda Replication protein O N-terminal domain-containing protein n=1 Tax=Paenibacillus odorifer TaxID=189426 RepID=A0ABX3GPD1_9BACL|nr:replication protein [Paenibacillus odorifer]OMD29931.1 hypothetical protein BSO21_18845 [Paenibacillus odorifer]